MRIWHDSFDNLLFIQNEHTDISINSEIVTKQLNRIILSHKERKSNSISEAILGSSFHLSRSLWIDRPL